MAEFKLGRIRFIWKDNWTASTAYPQKMTLLDMVEELTFVLIDIQQHPISMMIYPNWNNS